MKKILFNLLLFSSLVFLIFSFSVVELSAKLPKLSQFRPFQIQGEKLKFEVSYLGVVGGYATMITTPLKDKKTLKFEVRGNTIEWVESIFKLRLYLGSFSSAENFQTFKYLESKQENERYYYNVQHFFPDKNEFVYSHRRNKDPLETKKIKYEVDGGISVLGAFYYGRTTNLEVGKTYTITCFFRDQERDIGVKIVGRRTIEWQGQQVKTIVISPVMKFDGFLTGQKRMEVYLSDDKYKVPLLVDTILAFGSIKATLIEGHPTLKKKN